MTETQWKAFKKFREEYKSLCVEWSQYAPLLAPLQKEAAQKDTPPYPIENSVVYNTLYDDITQQDEIHLIVIGDNPGKEEQLEKNRRYLVGQSGRIAEGFFRRNPELQTDFRKNVIICNKTPVHTAKTAHLKYVAKNGGLQIKSLIEESQIKMAKLIACLHQALVEGAEKNSFIPQLWLVGYAELKKNGIFTQYRDTLKSAYWPCGVECAAWNYVRVYQHFSMNRFLVDLRSYQEEHKNLLGAGLEKVLAELGECHRDEIFL